MSAKVKDVMTTRVVAVKEGASFKDIATMLRRHRVSAFPVIDDDGKVIGVVSEADMLAKEALIAASADVLPGRISGALHHRQFAKATAVTAAELMTKPPVMITQDEPVTSAARLMYQCRVKRLPVVTEDGRLAGIISRADVLSVYSRPDEEISQEITENVILNEFLVDPSRFTVTVKDGIVTLEGRPETAESGRDIVAEIWHVQGVVAVRDRLSYPSADHRPRSLGPLF
jgi:CBS domain-containing protein